MPTRRNFYLGLFVLAGFSLLTAALFAFGMSELLVPKARLVTWFSESVQGLAVGSPVKYKGVPIGNVKKITIELNTKQIQVDMNVELDSFHFGNGDNSRGALTEEFDKFISQECRNGLRCRLEYSGLTGLKYVEIDYFDPLDREKPLPPAPVHADQLVGIYLPSKPSSLTDMLEMVSTSLAGIAKIDFAGISQDLRTGAQSLDKLLNDPKLAQTLTHIQKVSENLETSTGVLAKTMTEAEIRSVLDSLRNTADGVQTLTRQVEEQLKQAEIPASTASFRGAMDTITESRGTLENTALELNRTLNVLNGLIEMLDTDPSSILRGKRRTPLDIPLNRQ